jgi:hypothetical protein
VCVCVCGGSGVCVGLLACVLGSDVVTTPATVQQPPPRVCVDALQHTARTTHGTTHAPADSMAPVARLVMELMAPQGIL